MFAIVREPIDVSAVEDAARIPGAGASVTFVGIVRATGEDGRSVAGLSYESYDAMALAEFEAIAREARERHGGIGLAIVHRRGELKVGEIAVVVSASAPHRAAAFAACSYTIDELKSRAAIWKKELYVDGTPGRWCSNAGEART